MTRHTLLACILVVPPVMAATPDTSEARAFYEQAEFESSLNLLLSISGKDAAIYFLIGQDYYMLQDFDKAQEAFLKSIELEPRTSAYHLWLGRALGRRAETSSPFRAPGYAVKARRSFERAVELDPNDLEALGDLFEYYLAAPGFVGGGIAKAVALSGRIAALDPAEGAYTRYRLAEKRKNYVEAEKELRRASELAPAQLGRKIDLARFLAARGRLNESDSILEAAAKVAPGNPRLLFERARIYIDTHRNLNSARQMLRQYLAAPLTPDDPPRDEARLLLKKIPRG